MLHFPIIDYKEDIDGNRYDYALMFLQEHHIKTILGSLLKDKLRLEILMDSLMAKNAVLLQQQHATINNLIRIISQYKPQNLNQNKNF